MKDSILSYFDSGLLLLAVLTIAVIAGQTQSRYDTPESGQELVEMTEGKSISIDRERIEKLEALLMKIRTDMSQSAPVEIVDLTIKPVQ